MPVLLSSFSVGRRSLRLSKRRKQSYNLGRDTPGESVVVLSECHHPETSQRQTFHPRSRAEIRTHYHHYVQDYDVLHFPNSASRQSSRPATGLTFFP